MKIRTDFFAFITVAAAALVGAPAAQAVEIDAKKLIGHAYLKKAGAVKNKKLSFAQFQDYNRLIFYVHDRNGDGVLDLSEMPSDLLGPTSLKATLMGSYDVPWVMRVLRSMPYREYTNFMTGKSCSLKEIAVENFLIGPYGVWPKLEDWKKEQFRREKAALLQLLDAKKDFKVPEKEFHLVMNLAFHQFDKNKNGVLESDELPHVSGMFALGG